MKVFVLPFFVLFQVEIQIQSFDKAYLVRILEMRNNFFCIYDVSCSFAEILTVIHNVKAMIIKLNSP
jgi:hypothetical protein